MKKLTIFLTILFCFVAVVDTSAKTRKRTKKRARTTRVVKKKRVVPPTIHENPYLVCEDTCTHVHGIDMSHYQGEVFWETVGESTKMAYVYLKATEGGDRIDSQYRSEGWLLSFFSSEGRFAVAARKLQDTMPAW